MDISIRQEGAAGVAGAPPAQRIDAAGRIRVDYRAVLALAVPLVLNSAVQTLLNLTDLWFIGRISTQAIAAAGSVHWQVLVVVLVLSGIGMTVQTLVAQAFGGRRFTRASRAVWTALWGILFSTPLFFAAAASGNLMLTPFGLDPEVQYLAVEYWVPRVAGAPFGAAVWGMLGFFNGIGRPRMTLLISGTIAVANAILNEYFMFILGWGIAGAAWASTAAQAIGFLIAMGIFLSARYRSVYRSHLMWRLHGQSLKEQFKLGLPMGLLYAADLVGFSIFQLMQTRIGAVDGAASQIVMMLTSLAYMPGIGISMAGTTLVGQAIGAGDRKWAMFLGTRVVWLVAFTMGSIGLALALAGPWLIPLFATAGDVQSTAVIALGTQLLWLAAAYQFFDGLNIGSSFCLRGAGDVAVPAALVVGVSWFIFVPLAHAFIFEAGQGWLDVLPQMGWGAVGGWAAVDIYVLLIGTTLFTRWRTGAWKRVVL